MQKAVDILCACTLFQTEIERNPAQRKGFTSLNKRYYRSQADFAFKIIPLNPEVGLKFIKRRYGYDESNEFPPFPMIRPRECTDRKIAAKDSLLVSLGKLLMSSSTPLRSRIFRVINQFNSTFVDSIPAIPFPKALEGYFYKDVVALATAFEMLLIPNYTGRDKNRKLCLSLIKLFKGNEEIEHSDRIVRGKKEMEIEAPWKGWWLCWFYQLRNDIVHGEKLSFKDLEWSHNPYAGLYTEVAIKVFRLALMKTLVDEQLHTETEVDTWQANKLDEWLSTKRKYFPSAREAAFGFWKLEKELKSRDEA